MAEERKKRRRIVQNVDFAWLLPNLLTIMGLVCGLTAIRYALDDNFEIAVLLIIIAAVIDGLDGRMARLLKSSSDFGADLDSLSDLVVFGVVPVLIMYLFALHDGGRFAWGACLFYTSSCALRLARFKSEPQNDWSGNYFTGVPVPAAAGLVLLPIMASFRFEAFAEWLTIPALTIWIAVVGALAISTLPTFGGKKLKLPRYFVRPALGVFVLILAAIVTWPWFTLVTIGTIYLATIPISIALFSRTKTRAIKAGKLRD